MARKVIIDCDPGIDDAVALCVALFDPRLEVLAITGTAGNVPADQVNRNVQAIIAQLDPPRRPRLGSASEPDAAPAIDARHIHGDDGLGNTGLAVSLLQHPHPSEKIIIDEVRAAPEEVTILCLGPLTNVARALQRDPEIANLVDRLVIMGGSVEGIGNVTPSAEYNIYFDPLGARSVFHSRTTKTLVPLDVTSRVSFGLGLMQQLPDETTRVGRFLRKTLPYLFRAYHQRLGLEAIFLHDVVAVAAAVCPEFFETRELTGDVEIGGVLTTGMTVFDRRPTARGRGNMEVAMDVDVKRVVDFVVRGLATAARSG